MFDSESSVTGSVLHPGGGTTMTERAVMTCDDDDWIIAL